MDSEFRVGAFLLQVLLPVVLTGLLSGSLVSVLVTRFFHRQNEQISAEVRQEFQRRTEEISGQVRQEFEQEMLQFRSTIIWKEQALSQLLGPVVMQLDRTDRARLRWDAYNYFIEGQTIREGNTTIRDLLLSKGHLIPPDLLDVAGRLIAHYDHWLEEYERVRNSEDPNVDKPFTFTYDFPQGADLQFQERFHEIWKDLYGEMTSEPNSGGNP